MGSLRVALVHDYLVTFGGGERVLLGLHKIWPKAPVFVALVDPKGLGNHWRHFKNLDLRPSWWQKVPRGKTLLSPLRFVLPLIWESFNFDQYDLVISSSAWAIAKGVITKPETIHICYCHTPPRFLYHYPGSRPWQKYRLVRWWGGLVNHYLRFFDYLSAQRVDYFVANSQEVAERIWKFYHREAKIIPPPVLLDFPKLSELQKGGDYYLFVGRLVAYKHPELAIKACLRLGRRLVVVGVGPMEREVVRLARQSSKITWLGAVSDQRLRRLYQGCRALIFPVESEDFGIVPLEAAAFGKPTVAFYSGGARETVVEGKTGVFFRRLTTGALIEAIEKLERLKFSPVVCWRWAKNFSQENFQKRMMAFVKECLKKEKNG